MRGKDSEYKPDIVQKRKFENSPLGQVFNKGLNTSERKEGLLKRLKNIESKNEQQLEAIRDQGDRQLEAIKDFSASSKQKEIKFGDEESQESKILRYEIKKIDRGDRNKKLAMFHSNRTYDLCMILVDLRAEVILYLIFMMVIFQLRMQKKRKTIWRVKQNI